ncbi:hypothetical protein RCC89_05505 [Cytophagaceae bacterium ABcell3]|nr:hypothetical protein RCC89_05505 [Cytophagaceae bacterium ABcell3]
MMLKKTFHIALSLVLLVTVTGVSTANMICNFSAEDEVACLSEIETKDCASQECCEFSIEHKKLEADLSDEKEEAEAPEVVIATVPLFNAVPDLKVTMRYKSHGELIYKTDAQPEDINVLNQNFRL